MAYFLRNFARDYSSGSQSWESSSMPGPSQTAFYDSTPEQSSAMQEEALQQKTDNAHARKRYSELLLQCAKLTHRNATLGKDSAADSHLQAMMNDSILKGSRAIDFLQMNHKYTQCVAVPSLFAANFLALTTAIKAAAQLTVFDGDEEGRPAGLQNPNKNRRTVLSILESIIRNPDYSEGFSFFPQNDATTKDAPLGPRLLTTGLESIFSILLELKRRDAELCATALQSLSTLLQAIPPEGFIHEPKSMVDKMFELLCTLKQSGTPAIGANANACILSLAVARGEPEFMVAAIKSFFCEPREASFNETTSPEDNALPKNFQAMALTVQRLVHGGTATEPPGFGACHLPDHAEITTFDVDIPGTAMDASDEDLVRASGHSCVVSDGGFVYILTTHGLIKVGTGLSETVLGQVKAYNEFLKFAEGSSLFICQESLYLRRRHSTRLWVIDRETLREIGEIMLHASLTDGLLFCDGRNFFQGTLDDQWNLMVTRLDDSFSVVSAQRQKHANRLVEFSYVTFGESTTAQDKLLSSLSSGLLASAIDVQLTPESAFLLTRAGEVLYSGRGSLFSDYLKDTTTWTPLVTPEPIIQIYVDQFSNFVLFRSGSGHLYYLGTFAFLESGTPLSAGSTTARKVRKIKTPNRRRCVFITGISGAVCYVTDNGKVHLFGRHTVAENNELSQLTSFDGYAVASVGIGKTHAVAITKSGLVYTCGLNNLNQCGRDEPSIWPSTSTYEARPFDAHQPQPNAGEEVAMCAADQHLFIKDPASVCLRCGQCSSTGDSCPTKSTVNGIRKASLRRGMMCVCHSLESVCLRCGCCKACVADTATKVATEPQASLPANQMPPVSEATTFSPTRLVLHGDIKVSTVSCGNYHTILLCADHSVYTFGSNCHGQLGTGDIEKRSGGFRLQLPSNMQVVQAVAGANHCVLRTLDGRVFTFGAHKQGQLGRVSSLDPPGGGALWYATPGAIEGFGQAAGHVASWVSAVGDRTVIQVQRQTFSRAVLNDAKVTASKQSLIIVPAPGATATDYVVVARESGEMAQFRMDGSMANITYSLDPLYEILWAYDGLRMKLTAYSDLPAQRPDSSLGINNVESLLNLSSTATNSTTLTSRANVLKRHQALMRGTEFCAPSSCDAAFSDTQMGLFVLTTTYSMCVLGLHGKLDPGGVTEVVDAAETPKSVSLKKVAKRSKPGKSECDEASGYCALNRFDSFGGGWGYSAHCVEAVQFKVSKSIFLSGIGLFGGRGEYAAKVRVLRVVGGGMDEQCVELLAESDEVVYECAARETAVLHLNKNVLIHAEQWHVLWAQIQGPSSDCGASGRSVIFGAGEVEFTFRNSLLSNNGTDVDVGQIPEIYYVLKNNESDADVVEREESPKTPVLTRSLLSPKTVFSPTIATVRSLLDIFRWATASLFDVVEEEDIDDREAAAWASERSAFVGVLSLRLARIYLAVMATDDRYLPTKVDGDDGAPLPEGPHTADFAGLVLDFSMLLTKVFASAEECTVFESQPTTVILNEAIDAFVGCSDLLLPTPAVVRGLLHGIMAQSKRNWAFLALLLTCQKLDNRLIDVLFSADSFSRVRISTAATALAEKLTNATEVPKAETKEGLLPGLEVVRFLFAIAFGKNQGDTPLRCRLKKAAQAVIVTLTRNLVVRSAKLDTGPPLRATDNRFRRFNNHLNWETGTGAHDAIAFKTDVSNVVVHGIGIFVGAPTNGEFSYDLETFVNTGDFANECWSLIDQQSGQAKDLSVTDYMHLQPLQSQRLVTGIKLAKPLALHPDTVYAVRLHLSAGKTFYGEGGHATVKLVNAGKIHFLPCSLSRNGTNTLRGQLPYLLYTIEDRQPAKMCSAAKENDKEAPFWMVDNDYHNVFIEVMRQLSQRVSQLVSSGELDTSERLTAGHLVAHATVFLEANPARAFNVIVAFDDVIPALVAASSGKQQLGSSGLQNATENENSGLDRHRASATSAVQSVVESPHPYRSGQMYSQVVTFEESVEFVALRFHDDCATAQSADVLTVYVGHSDSGCFYAMGRFHGAEHWPERQLLFPGNRLWFVLEAALPDDDLDPDQFYGFRCTVEGIASNRYQGATFCGPTALEQQFAWLCSSACRFMVEAPLLSRATGDFKSRGQDVHDLIRKHGSLLKKGLFIEALPSIKDAVVGRFPGIQATAERQALDDFINASPRTASGRLARALSVGQPFLDVLLSTIEIEAIEVVVGRPVKLILAQKDQFNRDTRCAGVVVELTITSADDVITQDPRISEKDFENQNSPQTNQGSFTTTDDQQNWRIGQVVGKDTFQTLKQMQLNEKFTSIYLNKVRYKSITMMPIFADFSFEELRLAFQQCPNSVETMRMSYSSQTGFFTADWRPRRAGRYKIDCCIDGTKLGSTTFIEVADSASSTAHSLFARPPTAVSSTSQDRSEAKRGVVDAMSPFAALRIRAHPSLSAPISGVIERGCTVTWVELVKNDDGTWVRLTDETCLAFGDDHSQSAWVLQYHKAFERTLLIVNDVDLLPRSAVGSSEIRPPGKALRRQLPSVPPKPHLLNVQLNEEADVLTVRKPSSSAHSSSSTTTTTGTTSVHESLSPRLMQACRSVFAAIVWHERMGSDLMSCANHLKATPGCEELFYHPDSPSLPPCFAPIIRLYRSTVQTIIEIVEQHLILPSAPSFRPLTSSRHAFAPPSDELCELCRQPHPKPITAHMREKHPGCGGPCGGFGYNSIGNYTTGWTGLCGDGGRSNAVWYLMCPACRADYVAQAQAAVAEVADEKTADPEAPARPAKKMDGQQLPAEIVLQQNAAFLLELCPCEERTKLPPSSKPTKPLFTVDVHPQALQCTQGGLQLGKQPPGLLESATAAVSPLHHVSHQSDPGATREPAASTEHDFFSLSASAHLFNHSPSHSAAGDQATTSLHSLNELLRHPVLLFCVETHNLPAIELAFQTSVFRSVKFAYAFRVWNWLLKLVTSEAAVIDVIWNYLTALGSYSSVHRGLNTNLRFATRLRLLSHPWRLCFLSGTEVSEAMINEMHGFLGTLAVILQSQAASMPLKCLCFKAWAFQLTVHEQPLLLTMCNILSAVAGVLSDSANDVASVFEESTLSALVGHTAAAPTSSLASSVVRQAPPLPPKPHNILRRLSSSHVHAANQVVVRQHENLSGALKIVPSSRPQLVPCLVDGSLDTFWESGEEEKNRARQLSVSWDTDSSRIDVVAIFVDNVRDAGFKVGHITVRSTKHLLFSEQLEWTYVGWVKVAVQSLDSIQINLKGSEAGCRLRQIVGLGTSTTAPANVLPGAPTVRSSASHQMLFTSAQMDAFILFQSIAAQAFSDELAEEQNGTLRQHVIDMLFDRVQLQPLQSYVCFQMVSAVEREIVSLRNRSKRNYSYVCGLMVMLVKICQSRKGLEVFSLRNGLLIILSELLLFAPQIVQLQTIETMGSLMKHFKPTSADCSQFLVNILASIAKAVSLQIKDKVTRKVASYRLETHTTDVPVYWRTDRQTTVEVALLLADFVNQITSGEFGETWQQSVQTSLAATVMNICHLMSVSKSSSSNLTEAAMAEAASKTALSLKTSQFWLSVAALSQINDSSWLELAPAYRTLTARRTQEPDPLCDNHDDGHTLAQFRCEICQVNLCRECFTILHLNKKKKSHTARLIGSSTMCPKVDVHEGCTRFRLSNILVLFNKDKLSGMVEITADIGGTCLPNPALPASSSFLGLAAIQTVKCRFCEALLKTESETLLGVCSHAECSKLAESACDKVLSCGHYCGGIRGEAECLPCFVCPDDQRKQDADDLCVICFVERLGGAPCIRLKCGHLFHYDCVRTVLIKRWAGPRIVFRFMQCPLCKVAIDHPALRDLMDPLEALYDDVTAKAKMRLEYDGLLPSDAASSDIPDPVTYALERYVYVLCHKCGKAYFGGESSCQDALNDVEAAFNPEELLCGGCSDVAGAEICGRHGAEYLEYKCRYCCSVAVYFCFASTHFCTACHAEFQRLVPLPKTQLPQCPVGPRCVQLEGDECPLRIQHPPTGEECCLGCGICRNIRTF